jgi:uncharacterized protein (TIRG00374 family)
MKRKGLLWIIRLATSCGILLYIFNIIPYEKVLSNIYKARPGYIIIAFCLMQSVVYVSACKLKALTDRQKMSLSVGTILRINYITRFYDLFLPQVVSNGVIRWYILSKKAKMPAQALASMLFNRLTDLQMLLILGFIFWSIGKPPNSSRMVGISLVILMVGLLVVYWIVLNKGFSDLVLRILQAMPLVPDNLIEKSRKLLVSMTHFQRLPKSSFLSVWGFNILQHLLGILAYYFFARSLGLGMFYADLGWIRTIILIVCTIPISIGGIGVREGSLIFLLGIYGVSSTSAVAFSALVYIGSLVGGLIGGSLVAASVISPERKKTEVEGTYGGI